MTHPEADLVALLRDELPPRERERVGRHVDACEDCHRALEAHRALLADLARPAPLAPEPHWGRYRAEIREKLERRRRRSAEAWRRWVTWPVPVALSAALVGVLVLVAVQGGVRQRGVGTAAKTNMAALEEIVLGRRLALLQRYEVVERLDLLEDLDVIQHLDGLSAGREG